MAIALDAVTTSPGPAADTFSHTTTGSNLALIVIVSWRRDPVSTGISGITYNGVSMTSVASAVWNNTVKTEAFRLVGPATGPNNVVVSWNSAPQAAVRAALSFTGVDQTTPIGNTGTNAANSTSSSINIISATDELVVDGITNEGTPDQIPVVGVDQTQQYNVNDTPTGFHVRGAGSTEPGVATTTMSWSWGNNRQLTHVAFALKPAAGGTTFFQTVAATGIGSGEQQLRFGARGGCISSV